jgi:hypothetical protein
MPRMIFESAGFKNIIVGIMAILVQTRIKHKKLTFALYLWSKKKKIT